MYVLSVKALCLMGAKMRSRKHDVCENYEKKNISYLAIRFFLVPPTLSMPFYFSNMRAKKLIFADIKHRA